MPTATVDPDTATAATVKTAYARLRGLRYGHDQAWYRYEAGRWYLGGQSSCLLLFPAVQRRARQRHHLYRDEVEWALVGAADGHRRGRALLEVYAAARTHMPALLTTDQVAERLGVGPDAVEYRRGRRQLYPLHGNRHTGKFFFATQVAALTVGGAHLARWQELADRLPPLVDLGQVPDWPAPPAEPGRLPIPAGLTEADRRLAALTVGHERGWFVYLGGDLSRADGVYTLQVESDGGALEGREVPAAGVLPYVYGAAAQRGLARLVAYRPGLG